MRFHWPPLNGKKVKVKRDKAGKSKNERGRITDTRATGTSGSGMKTKEKGLILCTITPTCVFAPCNLVLCWEKKLKSFYHRDALFQSFHPH